MPTAQPHPLTDLITTRVDTRWDAWAKAHPHLAQAIDRTILIESTVHRLHNDPDFQQALRAADLNEHQLQSAARLLDHAEQLISRLFHP